MTSDYDYDVHVRTILWVEDIGCKEDREGEEDDLCYVVQRHIIQPLDKNTVLCEQSRQNICIFKMNL